MSKLTIESRGGTSFANHLLEQVNNYAPKGSGESLCKLHELITAVDGMPSHSHIPTEAIVYLCGLPIIFEEPFAIFHHEENRTIAEKADILSKNKKFIDSQLLADAQVVPLKTITLRVKGEAYLLLTTEGNLPFDKFVRNDLSKPAGLMVGSESKPFNSSYSINPPDFDPRQYLGLQAGIVSPFAHRNSGLLGILYYKDHSNDGYVAIAASLTDTVVVRAHMASLGMNWWVNRRLNVPFRKVAKSNAA